MSLIARRGDSAATTAWQAVRALVLVTLVMALPVSHAEARTYTRTAHTGHAYTPHPALRSAVHTPIHRVAPYHYRAQAGIPRDSHGRIKRSSGARSAFKHAHPCPATGKSVGACPGYVIDHRTPLKRGGMDAPSNMQWQTREAAKAKDKWE